MSIPSFELLSSFEQMEFWKFFPPEPHTDLSKISSCVRFCEQADRLDAKWEARNKQRTFERQLDFGFTDPVKNYKRAEKIRGKKRPAILFSNYGQAYPSKLAMQEMDGGEETEQDSF